MRLVVFDLDGTLADLSHRIHLIKGKSRDWTLFFLECIHDKPIPAVIDIQRTFMMDPEWIVEIWSARSAEVEEQTVDWLSVHGIHYDRLLMRPAGDHTKDIELKQGWLDESFYRPTVIFDDRRKVVDMWRRNGILCCQVASGEF